MPPYLIFYSFFFFQRCMSCLVQVNVTYLITNIDTLCKGDVRHLLTERCPIVASYSVKVKELKGLGFIHPRQQDALYKIGQPHAPNWDQRAVPNLRCGLLVWLPRHCCLLPARCLPACSQL